MVEPRHLKNAPITEALIDIQTTLPSDSDMDSLEAIHDDVKDKYPIKKGRKKIAGIFTIDKGAVTQTSSDKPIGFGFFTEDEKTIFQARIDGFTFNKLRPYENWNNMRDEAYSLWKLYLKVVKPESINRIGLRYINRLELKLPIDDFADYLTSAPIVPEGLPQEVYNFLYRVVIPEPETKATATITQSLNEPVLENRTVPVILDIDVYKEDNFDINTDYIWEILEVFRNFKNSIFFNYITERTAKLCD